MNVKECIVNRISNKVPVNTLRSYSNERLSPQNSGDFLNQDHIEQLKDGSEIVYWKEIAEPEYISGVGILRRIGFTTKNGYSYSSLIGIPETMECNVPIIGTSAWFTSTEGHNEHTVRNFMRAGNIVFFVGAEGSYEPEEKIDPKQPITLADSAAAVLNFSYHAAQDLKNYDCDVDPEKRILIGESRGGMVS